MGYNLNGEHFDDSTDISDSVSVSINEDSEFDENVLDNTGDVKEGLSKRTLGSILISVFLCIVLICLCIRYFQVKNMEEHGESLTYSYSNFDKNCIFNETEYSPNTKIMLEGLEAFYDTTYIQPYIVLLDYDAKFDDETVRRDTLKQYQVKAENKNRTVFCLYLIDNKGGLKYDKVTVEGIGADVEALEKDLKSEAERLYTISKVNMAELIKYSFQSLYAKSNYADGSNVFNPVPTSDDYEETNPIVTIVSLIAVGFAVVMVVITEIKGLFGIDVSHDVRYKNPHSGYYKDSPWAIRQRDVERYMNSHSTRRRRW